MNAGSDLPPVAVRWSAVPAVPGARARRRGIAWGLIGRELAERGLRAALDNPCPTCGGPHGPVRVRTEPGTPPVIASVGYTDELAVVAVAVLDPRTAAHDAVGVDVEEADAVAPGTLARMLPAGLAGIDPTRAWVRVEASLKALGTGLRQDPAQLLVMPRAGGWSASAASGSVDGVDVAGPAGTVVSLAFRRAAGPV